MRTDGARLVVAPCAHIGRILRASCLRIKAKDDFDFAHDWSTSSRRGAEGGNSPLLNEDDRGVESSCMWHNANKHRPASSFMIQSFVNRKNWDRALPSKFLLMHSQVASLRVAN